MAFNIDPKDLNLQDAAGMQLVEVIRNLAKESGAGSGLSNEAKQALMDCFENVAWANDDGQDYYNALYDALFGTTPVTPTLVSISAVFNQGSAVIYDTDSLNTLKQYLVVTATYSDSSTATVNDYTLSGTLTAGTSTITASYQGQSDTFTVNVTASVTLVSISAVFTQGSAVIYDTDSLNTLKQYLVVTATYSDSSTATVNDYTLSGTLTAGTSTITVSYGGQTDTFTVNVTAAPTLVSISAVFTQGTAVIYNTDSLDTLKQYLVVTATYADSSTATVSDYTLSGTLTVGTSTITASYGGKTDTFSVTVTAVTMFAGKYINKLSFSHYNGQFCYWNSSTTTNRKAYVLNGTGSHAIPKGNTSQTTTTCYPLEVPAGASTLIVYLPNDTLASAIYLEEWDGSKYVRVLGGNYVFGKNTLDISEVNDGTLYFCLCFKNSADSTAITSEDTTDWIVGWA